MTVARAGALVALGLLAPAAWLQEGGGATAPGEQARGEQATEPASGRAGEPASDDESARARADSFLASYCFECHGERKQKAGYDFESIGATLWDGANATLRSAIAEQLSLGRMPPEKARQPDRREAWDVVSLLSDRGDASAHGGRGVLRRLSAFEYRNTVRDLLEIDVSMFDPTAEFPPDESHHGFDNVGETLVTSSFLLERYLEAADAVIERARREGERPTRETYVFTPPFMQRGGGPLPVAVRADTDDFEGLFTRRTREYGYVVPDELPGGVPESGEYVIRVRASAVGREHSYKRLRTDPGEPLILGIVAARGSLDELRGRIPEERVVAEFDLDETAREFECRTWLDAGVVPRVSYLNGPANMPMLDILSPLHPQVPAKYRGRKWTSRLERLHTMMADFWQLYEGPHVRVERIEIEGPIYQSWPPPSTVRLFGGKEESLDIEGTLVRFASRAFRRPVELEDIEPLIDLVYDLEAGGASERDALASGLKAILCAPDFLYLRENEGPLDDYALASRLSYFVWSSMPDDELFALAAAGELSDAGTLLAQLERMLDDPKAAALATHFTDRWLQLYKIGEMPPDPEAFRVYYDEDLADYLARESHAFFAHVLAENLDVAAFLDSDFTFANSTLARLYGIRGVAGNGMRRVELPNGRRGGILGHAGVLTATANGIDTSPIVRGVWVLENVLGQRPAPPPAGVKALEPDTRGATTIREQLVKHREVESCSTCHSKIDPMGFPLENYDPIGRWRNVYAAGGPKIDAAARTTDGAEFADVQGLKRYLLANRATFTRCITEKLVTYATGAPVEPPDREQIDLIVAELEGRGNGLRDLVGLIVASELFRHK